MKRQLLVVGAMMWDGMMLAWAVTLTCTGIFAQVGEINPRENKQAIDEIQRRVASIESLGIDRRIAVLEATTERLEKSNDDQLFYIRLIISGVGLNLGGLAAIHMKDLKKKLIIEP